MEYFSITQMKDIDNAVELHIETDKFYERQQVLKIEDADKILDSTVMYVTTNKNNFYSDLIDTPIFLISDGVKEVLGVYTDDLVFKCVTLTDFYQKKQEIYWLTLIEEVECISSETTFKKDGTLKELVLDKNKIDGKKIFRVAGVKEKIVIMDYDICESLLRRDFGGIDFEHIKSI